MENFQMILFLTFLGKRCMKEINGSYIINKYNLKDGMQIKQKIHEERINWLKKRK